MALRILLFYSLFFVSSGILAQVPADTMSQSASIDSTKHIQPSDTLKALTTSIEAIPENVKDTLGIPSIETHTQNYQARLDSLTAAGKLQGTNGTLAPAKIPAELKPFKLPGDSLRSSITHKKDSIANQLNPNKQVDKWQSKLDSLERKTLDTLTTRIEQKFSGLRSDQDSLTHFTEKPGEAISKAQNQAEHKIDQATSKPEQQLNEITDQDVLQNTNLPVKNLPTSDLSPANPLPQSDLPAKNLTEAIPTDIATVDQSGLNNLTENLDLPTKELPDLKNGLNDIQPDINIGEELSEATDINLEDPIGGSITDVQDKVGKSMEDIQDLKTVETAKEKTDGLKEISSEIDGIESDVAAAKAGDSEALENRIADRLDMTNEIDEVRQQQLEMEELQVSYEDKLKMMREWQDQEVFQQKLEEALKQEAPKYFLGKEEKILEGQKLLFAYKQKYSEVSSIKDLPQREARAIRSERFLDKFMIGTDMEFVRADVNFLDIAPYLGYELTRRWHIKAGYGWRMNVAIKDGLEVKTNGTHGLRTSVNYLVYKGFIALAGYERSRVELPEVTPGIKERAWSDLAVIGIRKKYKIFKSLHGDGQVLYNITLSDNSLYENRINLRFGFFLDFTAKHK